MHIVLIVLIPNMDSQVGYASETALEVVLTVGGFYHLWLVEALGIRIAGVMHDTVYISQLVNIDETVIGLDFDRLIRNGLDDRARDDTAILQVNNILRSCKEGACHD